MNPPTDPGTGDGPASHGARGLAIPELVAEVYETALPAERGHMLEQLLRPLGVLSLVAIADGVFAKIRFRGGWQELHVRMEDLRGVRPDDIVALVDHAQQVSIEAVDGLARLVLASPGLSGSAAAMLLVGLLLQRSRLRQAGSASGPVEPGT
ncbi:MAG: hypothetical protein KIT86_01825 [Hydrogenophaga sp.]|jgi:hypothetical protein|uniref:hypothetical protein n=1 Tax=Hydrogenophaga sp. TaxID=1904254 RepID=UPI0026232C5B|nr:hypothetical protein [Hydrogenophaga sp.]MCW5668367.1 hypothetical protein [Hydrogenophaga sp.]